MRYLIVLVLMMGCVPTITSLEGRIDKKYIETRHSTVDTVKAAYFTVQAREYIKDIPCVDGFTIGGSYVVGANGWGTLAGILSGSGYSPKCVMSKEGLMNLGPQAIIHEYIHHLDASGRNGEEEFINIKEFADAFVRILTDRKWAGLAYYVSDRSSNFVTDTFGIGGLSEHIAYIGSRMASQGGGPDYMWKVFRRILKTPQRRTIK